ncbi:MAG: hypothetical protein QGI86_07170 [Candidatus Poribacteria bacterium]|nr:hypothetical protein [Candidatus Poribacteria bacterium]MDP6996646.1 hypothetical protein [Candidatus Poribacteria bacterium]
MSPEKEELIRHRQENKPMEMETEILKRWLPSWPRSRYQTQLHPAASEG